MAEDISHKIKLFGELQLNGNLIQKEVPLKL